MEPLFVMLVADDPFGDIRKSLSTLVLAVLGLVAMVSLAVVVINIIQGDREGAKKASVWFAATAVGFTLITLLGSI